jgi:hypothetical protein
LILYDLDLESGTGRFVGHDGPITDEYFDPGGHSARGKMRTRENGKKVGLIRG